MHIFKKCTIWKKAQFSKNFTGPDLKRTQCTSLSARRVRRTKSRGLKGLQLEVRAQRAPRLLVNNIFASVPILMLVKQEWHWKQFRFEQRNFERWRGIFLTRSERSEERFAVQLVPDLCIVWNQKDLIVALCWPNWIRWNWMLEYSTCIPI